MSPFGEGNEKVELFQTRRQYLTYIVDLSFFSFVYPVHAHGISMTVLCLD